MPLTFDWPSDLDIRDYDMNIVGSSKSGPTTLGGKQQIVLSPNERWKCSFSVPVTQSQILSYRAFLAKMQGRLNYCRVPAFEGLDAVGIAGFYRSDKNLFSDGSSYGGPTVVVTTGSAAQVGGRTLQVYCRDDYPPLEGQRFSMPDDRLHEIAAVAQQAPTLYLLTIRPGLRSDFAAGTIVNVTNPVCLMRFASDTAGSLQLAMRRFGTPTLDFIEV